MLKSENSTIKTIKSLYDERAKYGPYSTLAPFSKGNDKSKYISHVFDYAIFSRLAVVQKMTRVLDYGCGTGILTNQLPDYFPEVVGVDISEKMLAIAENLKLNHENVKFELIDGLTMPFKNNYFSVVIARESLCHVPDKALPRVASEICRVIEEGGIFLLLEQVTESKSWRNPPEASYTIKRSVDELIAVIEKQGLSLCSVKTVRKPRFPWIYLIQMGIVPRYIYKKLAKLEVLFVQTIFPVKTCRWHDVLFTFQKI